MLQFQILQQLLNFSKFIYIYIYNIWAYFLFNLKVVVGGNYDIDAEIIAPSNNAAYKEQRKQYDQTTLEAQETGLYRFCFSNEFSTFTHKVIYFDLQGIDETDY